MSSLFVRLMPALFVLLWATGFIGAKYGLPGAPPLTFLLLRFGIVILLMAALSVATRAVWPRGVQLAHVAVAGVLLQAGYLGGVFCAIDLGMSAGLAVANRGGIRGQKIPNRHVCSATDPRVAQPILPMRTMANRFISSSR